jgi:hypothetical protein
MSRATKPSSRLKGLSAARFISTKKDPPLLFKDSVFLIDLETKGQEDLPLGGQATSLAPFNPIQG